jgi:hypothetical protein
VLALSDKAGLAAEFHFVGDNPAIAGHTAGKTGVETSLYTARVDERDAELVLNLALANGLRVTSHGK